MAKHNTPPPVSFQYHHIDDWRLFQDDYSSLPKHIIIRLRYTYFLNQHNRLIIKCDSIESFKDFGFIFFNDIRENLKYRYDIKNIAHISTTYNIESMTIGDNVKKIVIPVFNDEDTGEYNVVIASHHHSNNNLFDFPANIPIKYHDGLSLIKDYVSSEGSSVKIFKTKNIGFINYFKMIPPQAKYETTITIHCPFSKIDEWYSQL